MNMILENYINFMLILYVALAGASKGADSDRMECKDNYCGDYSYKEIYRQYRGLFHTRKEILDFDFVYWTAGSDSDKVDGDLTNPNNTTMNIPDDNSICCSTRIEHIANKTLVNIYGDSKYIVHLVDGNPPNYQYIPHGSCVRTGSCTGTCVLESKIVTLLALENPSKMAFDLFAIPGYCTCKNIH